MTTVDIIFRFQGKLGFAEAKKLGESYTYLGIRRISVSEKEQTIAIEYDATRMDAAGVAAKIRSLGVPIVEQLTA